MKKIIFTLLICFCLISCYDVKYQTKVVYDVIYPDTTIRYDTIFNCETANTAMDEETEVYVSSARGTNYIVASPSYYYFHKTTCPIRIISYDKTKYDVKK